MAAALIGILPLAYILSFGHAVLLALGIPTREAIGLFVMITAVIALIGMALLLRFRLSGATERHPALSRIYGVIDERGQGRRVSPLERPDPWTMAQLGAGAGVVTRADMPMVADGPVWRAATAGIFGAPPTLSVTRQGAAATVTFTPTTGGRELHLDFMNDQPLAMVEIAGVALARFATHPGYWKIRWQSAGSPLILKFMHHSAQS